jgi:hypothetical protein
MPKIKQVLTAGAFDHVASSLENHHIVMLLTCNLQVVSKYVVGSSL